MNESYFKVPEHSIERFPRGFIAIDKKLQETPHWDLYKTAINPAGGIRSTIGDMVKYARANLNPVSTVLEKSILKSHEPLFLLDTKKVWIGMNWIVEPNEKLVWHNGQTYGFNSILAVSKKTGIAVVAMTNTSVLNSSGDGSQSFDTGLQDVVFSCLK
jgi:CubicO group peptidase (beta-lactamase class C family)